VAQIKVDAPVPYDGTADFDKFENWTYAVDSWFKIMGFLK
jgi:hypothetical protein